MFRFLLLVLIAIFIKDGISAARKKKPVFTTVVVCEHQNHTISCPNGEVIYFKGASYGRQDRTTCPSSAIKTTSCSANQAKNIVRENCHHKSSCLLEASSQIFGDPCIGTLKYLSVKYVCKRPLFTTVVVCENKNRRITCPNGERIYIKGASYGRQDATTCPSQSISTTSCSTNQARNIVVENCHLKNSCLLEASNRIFGDPCAGTHKYLSVLYRCK